MADHASRLAAARLAELCSELGTGRGQAFDDDVAVLALGVPLHHPAGSPR